MWMKHIHHCLKEVGQSVSDLIYEVLILITIWTPAEGTREYDVMAMADKETCFRLEQDFREFVISQREMFLSIEARCNAEEQLI